jgi:hypothetical protein
MATGRTDSLNLEALQQFCSTEWSRPYLHKPFSVGGFTYAADGRTLLRVARLADAGEPTKILNWDKPLNGIEVATFSPLLHKPLPKIAAAQEVTCGGCNGSGRDHDCPVCDCKCEVCGGAKIEKVEPKVSTTVRGNIFNLLYLARILALPSVEFADKTTDRAPLLFRFTGGVGALMPMTRKFPEHVDIEHSDKPGPA